MPGGWCEVMCCMFMVLPLQMFLNQHVPPLYPKLSDFTERIMRGVCLSCKNICYTDFYLPSCSDPFWFFKFFSSPWVSVTPWFYFGGCFFIYFRLKLRFSCSLLFPSGEALHWHHHMRCAVPKGVSKGEVALCLVPILNWLGDFTRFRAAP